jgi:hypothetical protein
MKRALVVIVIGLFSSQASAATSCTVSADEKKLAGAAKASYLKKCEADAKSACEASAADKKLAGAAKSSYLKKCVADATGG